MTLAEARTQEDPPTEPTDEATAPVEPVEAEEEYEEYEPEVTDTRMGKGFGVIAAAALIVALASAVTAGATVFYILESTTRSEERTAQLVAALKEPQSYALQGSAEQQTSRVQFKVHSRVSPVPPQPSRVSLARRLKRAELRQAQFSLVPPALVVPHKDRQLQDRQLRQPQHHKPLLPRSKLHPSRQLQLRRPPQHRPQQLQPQCLPPTYCCKPPWPQPSLVSLVQS